MTINVGAWEHQLLTQAYAPLEKHQHTDSFSADEARLKPAYDLCQVITEEHSRTFYLASALMPRAQRKAIRALYAFCRISDDTVDEAGGDRQEMLQQWRKRTLEQHPADDDLVALAWADTRVRHSIPREYAEQLLDGVASDLTKKRYAHFSELADYCYAVASTVGLMSMHIVDYSSKTAIPYAVKLGVALQLTNILRDVGEDWANGRLYLPQDELTAFGLTEADIAAKRNDERWQAFMRFQIERAHRLYEEALPGIAMLGQQGRLAVAAAAELYRSILDDIERNQYDVFNRRAHVSGWEKLKRLPGIWWRVRTNYYAKSA
jgi:phytoene synthase